MYRHASTCLKGPVSRSRAWWQESPGEEIDKGEGEGGSAAVLVSGRDRRSRGMRLDLIARVRREIAAGTYDTPEKMEVALDRLFEQFDRS